MTPSSRDKGMSWGYGLGLLALLVTVVIGLYMWSEMVKVIAPTSNPADNLMNRMEKDIEAFNRAQAERQADYDALFKDPSGSDDSVEEGKTYDVVLLDAGKNQTRVIDLIVSLTTMDKAGAADLVRSVPMAVKTGVDAKGAGRFKTALESAGAEVHLKVHEE